MSLSSYEQNTTVPVQQNKPVGDSKHKKMMLGTSPSMVFQLTIVLIVLSVVFSIGAYVFLIDYERVSHQQAYEEVKSVQTLELLQSLYEGNNLIPETESYVNFWQKNHPNIQSLMIFGSDTLLDYSWQASEPTVTDNRVSVEALLKEDGIVVAYAISDWDTTAVIQMADQNFMRLIGFGLGVMFFFALPTFAFFQLMVIRHIIQMGKMAIDPHADQGKLMETRFIASEVKSLANVIIRSQHLRLEDIRNHQRSQRLQSYQKAVISNVLEGIIVLDKNDRISSMNPMAEHTLKLSEQEAIGKNLEDLLKITERGFGYLDEVTPLYALGEMDENVEIVKTNIKGDMERYFELKRASFDADDSKSSVVMMRDITIQQHHRMHLQKAKKDSEDAAQAKSQFLAMMSHEIRTPLNGILGILQLMQNAKSEESRALYVKQGLKAAESLKLIIGDLLDISRIEAGKLVLEDENFSPKKIADEEVAFAHNLLQGKQLKLKCKVDVQVPKWVRGDSGKIRQVIRNMLSNAIKFTEKGGVVLSVRQIDQIDTKRTQLLFSVQDTGIGIPKEKSEAVFREFDSVNMAYTRKNDGTGLGMAISKGIVEAMKGKIGFTSQLGKGSNFWFTINLPLAHETPEYMLKPRAEESTQAGLRVLIVEDNPTNSMIAQHMLEREKCKVMVAGDGIEALDMLEKFAYDVIFMDVAMPRMDGHEASRRIREKGGNWANIPIIAMTAHAAKSDAQEAKSAGMSDYLIKPVDQKKLIASLRKWTKKRILTRDKAR